MGLSTSTDGQDKAITISPLALWSMFPLTVLTMLPVTGVVPILKQLVRDHYDLSDLGTSLFMSINMVGALLAAPMLGWLSNRYGWTRTILVVSAVVDGGLWWLISLQPSLLSLTVLRTLEGAASACPRNEHLCVEHGHDVFSTTSERGLMETLWYIAPG